MNIYIYIYKIICKNYSKSLALRKIFRYSWNNNYWISFFKFDILGLKKHKIEMDLNANLLKQEIVFKRGIIDRIQIVIMSQKNNIKRCFWYSIKKFLYNYYFLSILFSYKNFEWYFLVSSHAFSWIKCEK